MHAALPGQNATPAMQDVMDRMHEVAFSFPDDISVIVEATTAPAGSPPRSCDSSHKPIS